MELIEEGVDKKKLLIPQRLVRWMGGVIVLIGLFIFYQMALSYEIRCEDKRQGIASQCKIVKHFYHLFQTTTPLGQLFSAKVVQTGTSSKNNTPLYSILLDTDDGVINLTQSQSSGFEDKEKTAEEINHYIQSGEDPRYKIPFDTPGYILAILLILPMIGVLMMFSRNVTVIFDKSARQIVILKKNRWMESRRVYPMEQVDKVVVEEYENTKGGRSYRLALLNHDQSHVPFTRTYSPSLLDKRAIADNLNHFMADVQRSESVLASVKMPTLERIDTTTRGQ